MNDQDQDWTFYGVKILLSQGLVNVNLSRPTVELCKSWVEGAKVKLKHHFLLITLLHCGSVMSYIQFSSSILLSRLGRGMRILKLHVDCNVRHCNFEQ